MRTPYWRDPWLCGQLTMTSWTRMANFEGFSLTLKVQSGKIKYFVVFTTKKDKVVDYTEMQNCKICKWISLQKLSSQNCFYSVLNQKGSKISWDCPFKLLLFITRIPNGIPSVTYQPIPTPFLTDSYLLTKYKLIFKKMDH